MRIQLISENTIKVTITKNDFQARDVDMSKFKPGTSLYRQLVFEIMAHASKEYNFNPNDCRIVIEGQVTQQDEITLLITRMDTTSKLLCPDCAEKEATPPETILDRLSALINSFSDIAFPKDEHENHVIEETGGTPGFPADVIIAFSDFEKLLMLLQKFPDAKSIASSLYSHNNSYFLMLKVYARNAKTAIRFRNFAMEFDGMQVPTDVFSPILLEHGTLVIKKGAIPFLIKKFSLQ